MSTLIVVEHNNQMIQDTTQHVLAAALRLDTKIDLVVVGYQCQSVAEQVAAWRGVNKVYIADNPVYKHQLAENLSQLIASIADKYAYILAPASTFGKDLMPRVAALLDCAQLSDVSKIINATTFEHPIYAGNAIETVTMLDEKKILTIRSTSFPFELEIQPPCSVEALETIIDTPRTQFIDQQLNQSTRPELGNAKIVVSGGRGLQSAEQFKLIEEFADCLGAAVGASRAAVDAGFAPNDYQVGQTGKIVAPDLYFAIGISGAIQHVAGMKSAKVIVAINKDADAPIFKIADYGLVGDLFELVPQLMKTLETTHA